MPFLELHIVGEVAHIRGNLANWFLTQMNHMYVVPVSALQGKEFHQYPRYMYKQGTTRVTHRAAGDHNSYTPCCRGPQLLNSVLQGTTIVILCAARYKHGVTRVTHRAAKYKHGTTRVTHRAARYKQGTIRVIHRAARYK